MFKTILQFSKCRVYLTVLCILAYSSMVERPAVNRRVAGSSPAKVNEMNMAQQGIIAAGVDVVLTNGTTEHFTLEDHDQTSLVGLQSQVAAGEENIPWHTSDERQHCKFYSNADMRKITTTAMNYVTWHVTYFRDLRIYIRSLTEKEDVEKITYGIDIPEAYQSEPLKAMMAQKS